MSTLRKLTIDDLDVKGKRVLVRVDFNVPLKEDEQGNLVVADDTRIREALPTIRALMQAGAKVILMSHLGRPKGQPDPKYSLAPVARRLEELLGVRVRFVSNIVGEAVRQAINSMPEGGVILLENTRFHPGETKNDPELARQLAELADVYVNDAFGSAHRAHASTEGVAHYVKQAAMGYLMKREVEYLSRLLENPEHPFVAILGGAKVSDKIGVIKNLLPRVDRLLIGGAMSYTFLKALGHNVGASRVEEDRLEEARQLYEAAQGKILLPVDHVVAPEFSNEAPSQVVEGDIPDGLMGLDIGPKTIERYREEILQARTVVWNGPMGVFEMPNFAKGTFAIAEALAEATDRGALTVVGGGDSVAAITQAGYADRVSHVSTGGGAMLEFLEGKELPGLVALTDKK
ncbi:phosphoglycerate kinase [Rhodothermus marinus]|uniref:phosphoglycerate kinase n=1 Tax=Rhodothermus marinus TaxID=29549 RepID=UPI0012BA4593|nr:phosphoglycerate kinase [Rhodothermus marinus]BBM70124.1 phosphoglycerate kinase [Rhodothermus marinus]BBM73110.1 phosphoglycerate kinase [Rhodothermus marinus]